MNVPLHERNRKFYATQTLDQLADEMGSLPPDSKAYRPIWAELQRRVAQAQIDAADAQKESAKWIFWTVVVAAAAIVLQAVLQIAAK